MSFRETPDQFKLAEDLPSRTRLPFRWSWGLGVASTLLAGLGIWLLQPVIPLFYSLADPNQQLVSKWWLLLFPGLSMAFTAIHFTLVRQLKSWTEIIITLLAWSCVVLQIILLMIQVRLWFIVW